MITLTLNIGLICKNQDVHPHHALNAIARAGFSISASRIALGQWLGEIEPCLVAVCHWHGPDPLSHARLYGLAVETGQDCIAILSNGKGELIGPHCEGQAFDFDLFHEFPRPVRTRN